MRNFAFAACATLTALASPTVLCAQDADTPTSPAGQEALEILREAIAVPTVEGRGQVPVLAEKLTGRLVKAGFAAEDVRFTPTGETGYLTARYQIGRAHV